LHQTRTQVVFGAGNANADLMFVGEAPGANEDRLGLPFVGQAGKLLEQLLGAIGLRREDVFIANTLKCRPPDNRDPHPNEIAACQDYLRRQVALIEPTVICTLGNFATKLLRADTTGISRLHGQPEERAIGDRVVRLLPLYHPAAALYTRSMLTTLQADFQRIPELLALGPPEQPPVPEAMPEVPEAMPSVSKAMPEVAAAISATGEGLGDLSETRADVGDLSETGGPGDLLPAPLPPVPASEEPAALVQLGLF
jgi:DNA polymerase